MKRNALDVVIVGAEQREYERKKRWTSITETKGKLK